MFCVLSSCSIIYFVVVSCLYVVVFWSCFQLFFFYIIFLFFFFKQKTAYEMRISDWSSDVCSSDLSVLTMEIIEEDSSLHHREWVDGSEYSGRGFDRTMEPELCRY